MTLSSSTEHRRAVRRHRTARCPRRGSVYVKTGGAYKAAGVRPKVTYDSNSNTTIYENIPASLQGVRTEKEGVAWNSGASAGAAEYEFFNGTKSHSSGGGFGLFDAIIEHRRGLLQIAGVAVAAGCIGATAMFGSVGCVAAGAAIGTANVVQSYQDNLTGNDQCGAGSSATPWLTPRM